MPLTRLDRLQVTMESVLEQCATAGEVSTTNVALLITQESSVKFVLPVRIPVDSHTHREQTPTASLFPSLIYRKYLLGNSLQQPHLGHDQTQIRVNSA